MRETLSRERRSAQRGAPARDQPLAGLEAAQPVAAAKGVGGAGHGLAAQAAALAARRKRVAGVELDERIGLVDPQRGGRTVGAGQRRPRAAGLVALDVAERVVDLQLADRAR